ncbi:MAG: hypothetical protein JW839_14460 [Candidatus Lokiarchaeota archaeon]|nr:hypothetical protein [Candidatus Lokiarchaeota archaeon]
MIADIVTGYPREPAIIMEWILTFLFLETGLMALVKHLNAQRDRKSQYDMAFALLFINIGLKWVFVLLGDFYATSPVWSDVYTSTGGIVQVVGCAAFVAIIERRERIGPKRLFSACFVAMMAGVIATLAFDLELSRAIVFLSFVLFAAFFTLFYKRLIRKSTLEPGSSRATALPFASFLALGFGHAMSSGIVSRMLDPAFRLVGDAIMIASVPGIYLFIARMLPFIEIDWYSKLDSLFIMHTSGVCIYSHYFDKPAVEMHDNLVTSAITSIRMMLEKLTDQGGISIIKKDQNTVIIFPGKHIFCVLICKEDIEAGRFLVKKFTDRIEAVFDPILDQWDGDMAVFDPVDSMRAEIFRDVSRKDVPRKVKREIRGQ